MLLKTPLRPRGSTAQGSVRSRWESASAVGGWPHPELWWSPGVDALIDACSGAGGNPAAAADRLGCERANAGVGLTDALIDLDLGLDLLKPSQRLRAQLTGQLSIGWANGLTLWFGRSRACRDSLTELTTRDYLATRLRELYAEAEHGGDLLVSSRVLVVVQVRPSREALIAEQRMVALSRALSSVFTAGETLSRLGPNLAVALARRGDALNDQLTTVQLELAWAGLSGRPASARTWLEPLPLDAHSIDRLIDDMTCI
jgi:GGDEF domain-containing protein